MANLKAGSTIGGEAVLTAGNISSYNLNFLNGNVGIGTASPGSKLEVIADSVPANTPAVWLHNADNQTNRDGVVISSVNNNADAEVLHVRSNNTTYNGGTSHLLVRGDGNVGIGTDSPGARLHIKNNYTNSNLRIDGGNSLVSLQCVNDGNTENVDLAIGPSLNTVYIKNDGKVGIGTTDPGAHKLFVNGSANVQGRMYADSFYLKSSAYEMWERGYVVNSTNHGELLTEAGGSLSQGGSYRVTAHIPGTGTHTGASAVFWNNDGTWYVNQTVQPANYSNHVGFYVSSDNKPVIRTWHTANYTISVLHERMQLGENDTENTRHLFGMDGLLSYQNDGRLYLNRYQKKDDSSSGNKLVHQTSQYSIWDVYKVSSNGFLMAHNDSGANNFWLGANTHYNSNGWKSLSAGRSSWGKFGGGSTSDVFGVYSDTTTEDGGAITTANNEMFKVTNTTTYDHGNTNIHTGNISSYAFNGGTVTSAITIQNSNPILILKDTNGGDANSQTGYINFTDNDNTSRGWVGFGSTGDKIISIKNNIGGINFLTAAGSTVQANSSKVFTDAYHPNADQWTTSRTLTLGGDLSGSVSINGGSNVTLNATVADSTHDDRYGRYMPNVTFNNSFSGTYQTADFINELKNDYGCFNNNHISMKVGWSYAGNRNLDTGDGTIELAGCVIETWGQGSYKHVRITRPNTGTGGPSVWEYNDQGTGYAPGWRRFWTDRDFDISDYCLNDDPRLSDARAPINHSADKITSGTLSSARIPAATATSLGGVKVSYDADTQTLSITTT